MLVESKPDWMVSVPEGISGPWKIERFTISEEEAAFFNMRATFSFSDRGRYIKAGTYTRLMRNGKVIMSDTPAEQCDHYEPVRQFPNGGKALLNGLGLGMVLQAMLTKCPDGHVTVIEESENVLWLVESHYRKMFGSQVEFHHADALTWKGHRHAHYDVVWHDIWDDICESNLPEMHKLHRRYGTKAAWQGSWGRGLIEARRR